MIDQCLCPEGASPPSVWQNSDGHLDSQAPGCGRLKSIVVLTLFLGFMSQSSLREAVTSDNTLGCLTSTLRYEHHWTWPMPVAAQHLAFSTMDPPGTNRPNVMVVLWVQEASASLGAPSVTDDVSI